MVKSKLHAKFQPSSSFQIVVNEGASLRHTLRLIKNSKGSGLIGLKYLVFWKIQQKCENLSEKVAMVKSIYL